MADEFLISILDTLKLLRPEEWHALEDARDLYVSYTWLASVEVLFPATARYVIVRNANGVMVAAVPLYLCERQPGDRYEPATLLFNHFGIGLPHGGALLVGTRDGYSNRLLISKTLDGGQRSRVRTLTFDAVRQIAKQLDRLPVMLYLDQAGIDSAGNSSQVPPLLIEVGATMQLAGTTFDECLRQMKPGRRRKLLADWKAFCRSGYHLRIGRLSDFAGLMGPLLANTETKYGISTNARRETEYLRAQVPFLDHISTVVLCISRGEVIGCSYFIEWGRTLYFRSCGFDYNEVRMAGEYGVICFWIPIQVAIERELKTIHYGIGSLEAKLLHGCYPEPLYAITLPSDGTTAISDEAAINWNCRARAIHGEAADRVWPGVLDKWLSSNSKQGHAFSKPLTVAVANICSLWKDE